MRAGKSDSIHWESLAKGIDTLAIYMGVGNLPYICEQLTKHGRPESTPVALIHWGTTEAQHTITGTLSTIVEIARESEIKNPSMIIVGEVVKLREKIQWFEQTVIERKDHCKKLSATNQFKRRDQHAGSFICWPR